MARNYVLTAEFAGNKNRFFLTEEFNGTASTTRECQSIYEKQRIPWTEGCDRRCMELLEDKGDGTWRLACRWWQTAAEYAARPYHWRAEPAVPAESL